MELDVEPIALYRIESCEFKRERESDWEFGILLAEGDCGILDMDGKLVAEVWNWRRSSEFALDIASLKQHWVMCNMVIVKGPRGPECPLCAEEEAKSGETKTL